jgi:hypothetical protein
MELRFSTRSGPGLGPVRAGEQLASAQHGAVVEVAGIAGADGLAVAARAAAEAGLVGLLQLGRGTTRRSRGRPR